MELTKLHDLKLALERLKEGLAEVDNQLEQDGAIKRFEFTFELAWKTIQEYAKYKGLEVVSPRDAFRVGADLKVIESPEKWFDFLKDRNLSSHIYSEEQAKLIFSHLPSFISEVEKLSESITKSS
jgi:nucleotidyltransferase substrate binding protein (TIGR01987 family)